MTHPTTMPPIPDAEQEDDWSDDDEERACWQCGGDGWGIAGDDWPCVEYGWDMPGDIQRCPCCGGSGDAKDCRYW